MNIETITLQRTCPRTHRIIKANETPAAKMQRLMKAQVELYADAFPQDFAEIARRKLLDKRK